MKVAYIARSEAVAARILAGEMIIMSAADSTLYSLNQVATAVWQAADGCTPLAEIVNRHICSEFDVSPDEACSDVEEFVEDLARHGILRLSDRPIRDDSAKTVKTL
jgi:coenzyme PQQ synthesis protein D (PqqD)